MSKIKHKKLKLFISHLSKHREIAANYANELNNYNIKTFVAHKDINHTEIWQEKIEKFLEKMDCMLTLLTTGYSESSWCNQEVGYCLGANKPIIIVSINEPPNGLIAKFQAHTVNKKNDDDDEALIFRKLILKNISVSNSIRAWAIDAFYSCDSFEETNQLCDALNGIDLDKEEIYSIRKAFKDNSQVKHANKLATILGENWIKKNR